MLSVMTVLMRLPSNSIHFNVPWLSLTLQIAFVFPNESSELWNSSFLVILYTQLIDHMGGNLFEPQMALPFVYEVGHSF